MTQLRKFRDAISNYFDELEQGIGKRGSSFMDIDAVSHNADTGCFLFREFKEGGETLGKGQRWTLRALSALPKCSVWLVRRLPGGQLGFAVSGRPEEIISEEEYRRRLRQWWGEPELQAPRPAPQTVSHKPAFERLLENDAGPTW